MFGRVRVSSSPPESLERLTPKLLKDDSLSLYESTLIKLKLGSKKKMDAADVETVSRSDGEEMAVDAETQRIRTIPEMFTKYTNQVNSSPDVNETSTDSE